MTKIKEFFETDKTLQQLDSNVQCNFDLQTLKGKVKSSKFSADIQVVAQGPGSMIQVVIDLPLLLTPFRGKVEEVLRHKLQKYLA